MWVAFYNLLFSRGSGLFGLILIFNCHGIFEVHTGRQELSAVVQGDQKSGPLPHYLRLHWKGGGGEEITTGHFTSHFMQFHISFFMCGNSQFACVRGGHLIL